MAPLSVTLSQKRQDITLTSRQVVVGPGGYRGINLLSTLFR